MLSSSSSSSSTALDATSSSPLVNVTRLDGSSSVTFGGGGDVNSKVYSYSVAPSLVATAGGLSNQGARLVGEGGETVRSATPSTTNNNNNNNCREGGAASVQHSHHHATDYDKWSTYVAGLSSDDEDEDDAYENLDDRASTSVSISAAPPASVTSPAPAPPPSRAEAESVSRSRSPAPDSYTKNGALLETMMWSQSRDEVTVRVLVPAKTRAKCIRVHLSQGKLEVVHSGTVVCSGVLKFAVWGTGRVNAIGAAGSIASTVGASEDEVEAKAMDWELQDLDEGGLGEENGSFDPRRCVVISLTKVRPAKEIPIWWDRVFVDDAVAADVSAISGRWKGSEARRAEWSAAWKAAHAKFKEKISSSSSPSSFANKRV